MKAFQKLVSISAAFAMLMGGCRGNMPEEIPSENLHSVSTEDSDIVASGECGAEGDNLTWVLDSEGTLTISGTGDMGNITRMGQLWDHYDNSIKTVIIEDGVTSIGEKVFASCESLTSITIPDSVTTIESRAFDDCSSLTSITIPDSVTSIGSSAFESCSSLTTITIPDNVTSIGEYAFYDCSSLTSITIPDSVTTIENCAFDRCSSLTSITISDSVTSIDSDAFDRCSSLTAIDVDTNNEYYASEDGVLFNKNKTVLIQYPMKKDNQKYMIPDSVTSIGKCAFYDCSSVTSITIPDSVTSIGDRAFDECSSLTSITLNNPNCEIDDSPFTIHSSATIYGYEGSTAQAYAEKHDIEFISLG